MALININKNLIALTAIAITTSAVAIFSFPLKAQNQEFNNYDQYLVNNCIEEILAKNGISTESPDKERLVDGLGIGQYVGDCSGLDQDVVEYIADVSSSSLVSEAELCEGCSLNMAMYCISGIVSDIDLSGVRVSYIDGEKGAPHASSILPWIESKNGIPVATRSRAIWPTLIHSPEADCFAAVINPVSPLDS